MVFSSLIGQPKAVKLLSRALAGDRLAHGYLFSGPDGVGKTTAARALAAALFCRSPEGDGKRPCGRCSGCLKFSSGNHPDFVTIKPEGAAVKIDQIRALKKDLSFPPFEAGIRVVLIEEVQTMRREAGNSLLKILEEPPPDNLLLLMASESEPVLPTIISRCQVIPFMPLAREETCCILAGLFPERNPEEIETLALLSGGCPGQVIQGHSEELLDLRRRCIEALLRSDLDQAQSVELALALAVQMAGVKEGLEALLDMLAVFFKETMVADLCKVEQSADAEVARARERWNLQRLSDMVQAVDYARHALAGNCNRGLVCEVLLLELLSRQS